MMVKQDNIPVLPTLEWFDQLQKEFLAIQNSQVAQIDKDNHVFQCGLVLTCNVFSLQKSKASCAVISI
mgnify:CR=1 FL=1